MPVSPTLLWFRLDLRLQDNSALVAALARGGAIIPVYILDDAGEGEWPMGSASRWWLHHSLAALGTALEKRGSRLLLARGDSTTTLRELARASGASALYFNRRFEPAIIERDETLRQTLTASGLAVESFNSSLLFEPGTVKNQQGLPFQVFTPFWRHCLALPMEAATKLPGQQFPAPRTWPRSESLTELGLLPRINWDTGFYEAWKPGEKNALARLRTFVRQAADSYDAGRNVPGDDRTSQLSPGLHFGEIGPRQVWSAFQARSKASGVFPAGKGAQVFLAEIGWREFAYHLLFHFPRTPKEPLRAKYARFPWDSDPGNVKLRSWQQGCTGYPLVDAGLRQLWTTGWMHNRVRMVVASFLVKHLRLSWTHGAAWFWDTLVDADLASNTLGWQWSAGCGADAAPYFRIFSPVLQGEKFDPAGNYVRRWVPALARLPAKFIHRPWTAPPTVLEAAGVILGETYPRPIVDHATARAAALAALKRLASTPR